MHLRNQYYLILLGNQVLICHIGLRNHWGSCKTSLYKFAKFSSKELAESFGLKVAADSASPGSSASGHGSAQ